MCVDVCVGLWRKEKQISISFTFLTDNEKAKYDIFPLWTDCSSCDVCLLGAWSHFYGLSTNQLMFPMTRWWPNPSFTKVKSIFRLRFLAFGREWFQSGWEWVAKVYRNGVALQDPLPLGNFCSFSCDCWFTWMFLNTSVAIPMEFQQKNSSKGNKPKVMRMSWLGLFISKRYNSASWTLQYLATILQQLSTPYSATFKPDQAGLLLFALLLYRELNCCEPISQKK